MSATSDETGTTGPGSTASASTLSANAAEFVPSRFAHGDSSDPTQPGVGGGGDNVNPLAEVPRFLTTCYPFVNLASPQGLKMGVDSPGGMAGAGRAFGGPATVATFAAGNMQHPYQHMGMLPQQVGYHPTTPLPWLPGLQPPSPFTPTLHMAPLTTGVHIPFDGGTPSVPTLGGNTGLLPAPKQDGLLPTPPYPPLNGPQGMAPGVVMSCPSPSPVFMAADRKNAVRTGDQFGPVQGRPVQAGRCPSASVSRGTQKETFTLPSGGRAHTIIMKDNSVQTDFNKDIANFTLQEKPSILYRRGQRKNKGNRPITSTDSEEVDSDSGYSSPLHRRNLVSNGTHPVRITAMDEEREPDKSSVNAGDKGKKGMLSSSGDPGSSPRDPLPMKGPSRTETVIPGSKTSSAFKKAAKSHAGYSPAPGVRETPCSPSVEKKDSVNRASPAIDCSGKTGTQTAVAAKDRERSRTPVNTREVAETECSSSVLRSHDADSNSSSSMLRSRSATTALKADSSSSSPVKPTHTSSSSSSSHPSSSRDGTAPKQSHSPGSSRRSTTPSPALLDFPTLKPAKRNEPPWSLTPSANKGKKGESCGFMGMVAESVKSYASIVKSLSSPSTAQPDCQPHSSPTTLDDPPGSSSGLGGSAGTEGKSTAASLQLSSHAGGGGGAWGRVQPQQTSVPDTNSTGEGWVCVQPGVPGGSAGDLGSIGEGWIQLPPQDGSNLGMGRPGGAWGLLPPGKVDGSPQDPSEKASAPTRPGSGLPQAPGGGVGSTKTGQLHSQTAAATGSSSTPPPCRKAGPIWVGEEGTVLKGRIAGVRGVGGGSGRQPSPATGAHGAGSARPELLRDIAKQHCDTRANHLGAVEGGAPSDNPSPHATPHRTGAAHSLSPDFPPISRSPDKDGNRTDSTHRQSALSGDEKTDEEGKKRRRRRRRRRRGRSQSGEGEGLSDGMSGMERTVSSSNISRSSDITLHFEDEDEFPVIGVASGNEGMAHSVVSSNEGRSPVRDPEGVSSMPHIQGVPFRKPDPLAWISYSDMLKRKSTVNDVRSRTQSAPGSCLSGEEGGDENFNSQPGQGSSEQNPLSKRARKRRKRRELANRAAEAELAEITLEQQMLRHKVTTGRGSRPGSGSRDERSRSRDEKSPGRGLITDQAVVKQAKAGDSQQLSGNRLHQPISLSIADMLDAFEKKKSLDQKTANLLGGVKKLPRDEKKSTSGNILDSSAPSKRGKERETPKPKKPSPLKKIILKEREEKKRMRMIGDCEVGVYPGVDLSNNPDPDTDPEVADPEDEDKDENTGNPVGLGESDLSQDGLSSRSVDTDQGVSPGADLSPISQTSPISMSPLTPGASPINSPIAGYLSRDPVVLRIHSRRFREYCTQILDKDIDMCCTALLHELVRFQDRMYHKDPNKAKGKRRVVLGLREVTKHLKLKKIKCVIISPNLEKIQSKGGLDEALNNILNMCQEQNVPFVFALGRRALGRACAKLVPVSVAGIFNYEGCEEKFNQLISLTHKGREAYADMVRAVEREIAENPPPSMMAGSSVPSLYAHMGHSRTPSGCSAISFTSSVLSEPISENYPHAEPETDSKGYEIVRDQDGNVVSTPRAAAAYQNGAALPSYQPTVDDFDDGNEADTEDIGDAPPRKKASSRRGEESREKPTEISDADEFFDAVDDIQSVSPATNHAETVNSLHRHNAVDDTPDHVPSEDGDSASESDSQHWNSSQRLPHIDSIHSNLYDLSTEILSQHSSRTLDNSEVMSTHSSRTLGDGSLTPNTEHSKDCPHTPDSSGRARTGRLMNKERVQSWVESCLQEEKDNDSGDDDSSSTSDPDDGCVTTQGGGVCDGTGGGS